MGSTNVRAEALLLVNQYRQALGLPTLHDFPKGIRRSPCDCALARAVDCLLVDENYLVPASVQHEQRYQLARAIGGRMSLGPNYPDQAIMLPSTLTLFVVAFDQGRYPDLEE